VSAAYDVIVIGAGHNGLTTAGLLAKRQKKVLVVERREIAGGIAASEEFGKGYRSAGLLHDTTGVRPSVVAALDLARHGFQARSEPPGVLSLANGGGVYLSGDPSRAAREIAENSPKDGEQYAKYRAFLGRVRHVLRGFLEEPPIDVLDVEATGTWDLAKRGLRIRRLGKKDLMELMRLPTMPVADWLNELFESEPLKAALALRAVSGTFMGPRSPGSNLNLLLWEGAAGTGYSGGGPALVAALQGAVKGLGGTIRTGARVEKILLGNG
jgi:phytoene dehydrogenase-like protein